MFAGTFAGMMAGVIGGAIVSVVLFILKRMIGCQKLSFADRKLRWVDVPPR